MKLYLNWSQLSIVLLVQQKKKKEIQEEPTCTGIYTDIYWHTHTHTYTHTPSLCTQKTTHLIVSCIFFFSLNGSNYSFKDCQHCTLWWANWDGNSVVFNGHTLNNKPVGGKIFPDKLWLTWLTYIMLMWGAERLSCLMRWGVSYIPLL